MLLSRILAPELVHLLGDFGIFHHVRQRHVVAGNLDPGFRLRQALEIGGAEGGDDERQFAQIQDLVVAREETRQLFQLARIRHDRQLVPLPPALRQRLGDVVLQEQEIPLGPSRSVRVSAVGVLRIVLFEISQIQSQEIHQFGQARLGLDPQAQSLGGQFVLEPILEAGHLPDPGRLIQIFPGVFHHGGARLLHAGGAGVKDF